MKKRLLMILFITTSVAAKELPSWGMTESQYKMPNFTTKMQKIGDQAVQKNWLLKITAPKDWHNKIRAALSEEGTNNVQVNFNDSLYKSITITATPGMSLKSITSQNTQPGIVKKQVVIDKPEMDTEIEAPEFENNFKADDILADMGEIKLTLPSNGHVKNHSVQPKKQQQNSTAEVETAPQSDTAAPQTEQASNKQAIKENLRMRYARGKTVDKTINYTNITGDDELFVAEDVVLVKRYVNRGVAVFYWMVEDYDADKHRLNEKGSGKYVKSSNDMTAQSNNETGASPASKDKIENPQNAIFNFVANTDDLNVQDQLRRNFIRNKKVDVTINSSQLKSKDILYVQDQTVLVERPLGNSRSAYFWLTGETDIQHNIEHMGPHKFVIQ
ncbi:MAG: hypothetical protein DWP95_01870 [Proteobacteria bacterium]|nr:MAG: hypothetical protein DWP95_01870 [Pseudomonadota bacterium]